MATDKNAHHGSRRLYSALEAASLLGIGRTYMFHLIATGQIDSVKIGKLRKVPATRWRSTSTGSAPNRPRGDDLQAPLRPAHHPFTGCVHCSCIAHMR
jgi:excisionase family DNA binding protein